MIIRERIPLLPPGQVVSDVPGVRDIVRGEMDRRRLSQNQIAYRSGVGVATVSRLMNGATGCDLDTIVSIVEGLGGTVEIRMPGATGVK